MPDVGKENREKVEKKNTLTSLSFCLLISQSEVSQQMMSSTGSNFQSYESLWSSVIAYILRRQFQKGRNAHKTVLNT